MRSLMCAFALSCLATSAGAADQQLETKYTLEQMAAKASKLRFEATEMAGHLRARSANLVLAEVRLQLLDENAEQLRQLLARYETAPAATASPAQMERLRKSVSAISGNVEQKKKLLLGPEAEKRRGEIRSKAKETAKLSDEVRELAYIIAD